MRGRVAAAGAWVARLIAPITGWFRAHVGPYAAMVTALGWMVLSGAVVLGAFGWTQGWIEMRALGFFCLVLFVAAVLFTLGHWDFTVTIELASRRVRAGEVARGRVEVANSASRPSTSTTVELPVGRNVAAFMVPRLGVGEAHEELFQIPARRRGVIVMGPVRSVRSDPLALVQRQRTWTDSVELFVHPETVLLDASAVGFLKDVEGVATQNLSSSDVSFHALRDYVPGDDRRAIHWRTTARVGKLMVRQFEETMRSHLLLLLSLQPADYASADDFELAVSVLGSLGRAAIRDERQLSVYTSDGPVEYPSAMGLLDELCRLELREDAPGLRQAAAEAGRGVPDASVASVIVGSTTTALELRAAQLALPPDASTFALRCGPRLAAARRKAATLTVLDVSVLADLPRALRTIT